MSTLKHFIWIFPLQQKISNFTKQYFFEFFPSARIFQIYPLQQNFFNNYPYTKKILNLTPARKFGFFSLQHENSIFSYYREKYQIFFCWGRYLNFSGLIEKIKNFLLQPTVILQLDIRVKIKFWNWNC